MPISSPIVVLRFAAALVVSSFLAACAGGGPSGALPGSPGTGTSSHKRVKATIRIVIPKPKHKQRVRVHGHYVSVSVKSILITIAPVGGGGTQNFNADLTQGTNQNCNGTPLVCNLTIEIAPGDYVGKFATFDGLLFGGNAPGNPPTGNVLSANQDVPMNIVPAKHNQINLTLGGVVANFNLAPVTTNVGVDTNTGGYDLNPTYGSAQVQVIATDTDGNTILGPGAPVPTMVSADTSHLTATQVGTSNTFTLTSPQTPALSTSVNLNVTETPVAGTGSLPVSALVSVTFTFPVIEYLIGAASGYDLQGIAAGSDGNMWFTLANESEIGQILVSTPTTVNYFPTKTASVSPSGITAGPADGNLWFNEGYSNARIGKIPVGATPGSSSQETEYTITSGSQGFESVTAGPDGNIWFTDDKNNAVGKVTPAGAVTEFTLNTAGEAPLGITAGPNNTIWFTECGTAFLGGPPAKIGMIPTSAVDSTTIVEYPTGFTNSGPKSIVKGPDGNLWFADAVANKIAKITTLGVITPFTASGSPTGIAVGSDGNLWYTEYTGNNISRITTAGTITEFPIPTQDAEPTGIAAGPDGNIWFTECTGNNVGKVGL